MADDRIGVLLPVRLETRFLAPGERATMPGRSDPRAPDEWRIRLRVVPDEIWFDRHDPAVTEAERLALVALWSAVTAAPDPGDPAGAAARASSDVGWYDAFARLTGQVGAARAAWLVRTTPVRRTADGSVVVDASTTVSRDASAVLRGFPSELTVWVQWEHDDEPTTLAVLRPRSEVLGRPLGLDEARWLRDWNAAVAAGVAMEILLGDRVPEDIAVLGVTGLGPADRTRPSELFQSHADAGRLGVSGPGVATSTVHGASVWSTGDDARTWHAVASGTGSTDPTIDAIVGSAAAVGPVLGAGAHSESLTLAQLLVGVTFPALWGYGLSAVLGVVEPARLGDLWEWAAKWLRPEGPFGTLRVGDLAYGVLPVAAPDRVVVGNALDQVSPLLPMLARLDDAVAAAAEDDAGIVGGGVAAAVHTLRRGPVPGRVGVRRLVPTHLHALLAGQDPQEALDNWTAENAAATDVVGGLPLKRYGVRTRRERPLALPLLAPGLDADIGVHTSDAAEPVMAHIFTTMERLVPVGGDEEALFLVDADREFVDSLIARLYVRSLAVAGASLNIVRQNQEIEAGADPAAMGPRPTLFEPDVAYQGTTTVRRHIDDFLGSGRTPAEFDGTATLRRLRWLCTEGGDTLATYVGDVGWNPALRRSMVRALRGVLDASAGRWDPWFVGVAAAHLDEAHRRRSVPTLGAYGWVDRPARGRPGPGPGGVLLAPKLDQAATAAVVRDRSVRDAEPDRWAMRLDSAVVGPARRLLADVAAGWHPAELVGRMLERHVGDELEDDIERTELLARIRRVAPLRKGQGAFGCCHGFDLIDRVRQPDAGDAAWPAVVAEAVGAVGAVIDAAGDLLLAEGVHGFVHGAPGHAAAATEALAGQLGARPLDVLDPSRPGRSVQTIVLAQLPAAGDAGAGGAVTFASPGVARLVSSAIGDASSAAWTVSWAQRDGSSISVRLDEMGLGPADTVLLDDAAIADLAHLVASRRGDVVSADDAVLGPGYEDGRRMVRAWRGRCAAADDLRPDATAESSPLAPARATAMEELAQRRAATAAAASDLADRVEAVAEAMDASHRAADLAHAAGGDRPAVPVPPGALDLVVETAGWGFAPPSEVWAALGDAGDESTEAASVSVARHLGDVATELRRRLTVAQHRDGSLASDLGRREGTLLDVPSLAASIGDLVGHRELPIGAFLPTELIDGDLEGADAAPTATEWLPTIAQVRPRLAELAADRARLGLRLHAVDADDPWRVGALADAGSPTQLDVVVTPSHGLQPDGEWLVIDAFAEHVPERAATMGLAFDAATPGASPPQAILLVPPSDPHAGLDDAELPGAVMHARALARARMVDASTLVPAGLGSLMATSPLPQERVHGCPLAPGAPATDAWTHDDVAVLLPGTARTDVEDVVGAVTADPLWMLGVQWRLGEHLGENGASPVRVETIVEQTRLRPDLRTRPAESVVEEEGWVPDDLCYRTRMAAEHATGLSVTRHDGGPIDWWAVARDGSDGTASLRTSSAIPGRMKWPGAPRRRYWQLDDVRRDPAGRGPDASHPTNLVLLELLTRHGDDWYLAPLPTTVGGVVRPRRVTMVDAAGGRWRLRCPIDWSLFAVAGLDPEPPDDPLVDDPNGRWHRALPVFAAGASALSGPPVEQVAVAVDEDDNLVWCRVTGAGPQEPAEEPPLRLEGSGAHAGLVHWRLGDRPPTGCIPYVYGDPSLAPAFGAGLDAFVRARLVDPDNGEVVAPPPSEILAPNGHGEPVPILRPLAVPASGVRIERRQMLARDVNGRPVRWRGNVRRPLDVAVDAPLRWDLLESPTPEP